MAPFMHRWCCCGGCGPIIASIAGMDAAACCVSGAGVPAGGSYGIDNLAIDGDHTLTSVDIVGDVCTYTLSLASADETIHSDAACATEINRRTITITLTVVYNRATDKVTEIRVLGGVVGAPYQDSMFLGSSISVDMGVAVSNQETLCRMYGTGFNTRAITPGGTIEVNFA